LSRCPDPPSQAIADEGAVGVALDGLRTFRHSYWTPVLLGLAMLFDSWDAIAIAFAMPAMSAEWGLDPLSMGYVIGAGYGGQFIGAIICGAAAERFGRMPVLLVTVATMGLLAVGCAVAPGYRSLLVLRLLQGVMVGGASPVAITYINELAPARIRGLYFGIYQTLALSGLALASLTSPFIVPHLGWRWMFGLGAGSVILLPLIWLTLPESPRWLARAGRRAAANRALEKLGGTPIAFGAEPAAPLPPMTGRPRRMKVLALFSPGMRPRMLTTTMLWFLTMFVSIGVTTWLPSIFVNQFHIPVERALVYAAINSCLLQLSVPASGFLVDRFGRRPMGFGGMLLTALPLLLLSIYLPPSEFILVVVVAISQIANLIGAFTLWPFTAESYPTDMRALALGYASAVGRFSSMLTPIFVGFVLNTGAPIGVVFAVFGLFALAASVIWRTRTRETRGVALDRI